MDFDLQLMGNRIKNRRKEMHITQEKLAEMLGVSNNHISSIENAKQRPSLESFLLICKGLNVTPDYLLLGNLYANNIPIAITEPLSLCNEQDLITIQEIIECFVKRNSDSLNNNRLN